MFVWFCSQRACAQTSGSKYSVHQRQTRRAQAGTSTDQAPKLYYKPIRQGQGAKDVVYSTQRWCIRLSEGENKQRNLVYHAVVMRDVEDTWMQWSVVWLV